MRAACFSFKQNAIKLILNPLIIFITKVEASIGPFQTSKQNEAFLARTLGEYDHILPAEASTILRAQAFTKAEKIREVLEMTHQLARQSTKDLKHFLQVRNRILVQFSRSFLQLYIENQFARTFLLKPVLQEVDFLSNSMVGDHRRIQ